MKHAPSISASSVFWRSCGRGRGRGRVTSACLPRLDWERETRAIYERISSLVEYEEWGERTALYYESAVIDGSTCFTFCLHEFDLWSQSLINFSCVWLFYLFSQSYPSNNAEINIALLWLTWLCVLVLLKQKLTKQLFDCWRYTITPHLYVLQ